MERSFEDEPNGVLYSRFETIGQKIVADSTLSCFTIKFRPNFRPCQATKFSCSGNFPEISSICTNMRLPIASFLLVLVDKFRMPDSWVCKRLQWHCSWRLHVRNCYAALFLGTFRLKLSPASFNSSALVFVLHWTVLNLNGWQNLSRSNFST